MDKCPKCSRPLEEIYCRCEHRDSAIDLMVLECKDCKSYFAYWVMEPSVDPWLEYLEENSTPTKHSSPLAHSNPKEISKKCAEAYTQSTTSIEDRNKILNCLIQEKLPQLYSTGLSLATVNFARNKVINYLRNNQPTSKSLAKLLAGAVYATANSITSEGSSLWKHQGEGITEEKVKEIFGVTRKTTRKWKTLLQEKSGH